MKGGYALSNRIHSHLLSLSVQDLSKTRAGGTDRLRRLEWGGMIF